MYLIARRISSESAYKLLCRPWATNVVYEDGSL